MYTGASLSFRGDAMPANRILEKMLDRLYAALIGGPSLNCRPHSSRQRVDVTTFSAMGVEDTRRVLVELLGEKQACALTASVPVPASLAKRDRALGFHFADRDAEPEQLTPEERAAVKAWNAQKSLLTKLRNLSEDARTYEQDTGVPALQLGYPILSMPPAAIGGSSRRILAPLAFIPVQMEVAAGRTPGVKLACRGGGVDLVTPNPALMAWLERETGKPAEELFEDEEGVEPWREVLELIQYVCNALGLPEPDAALADPQIMQLTAIPRAEDLPNTPVILGGAVLGLFPATNQGLLRDTRAMIEAQAVPEQVAPFVEVDADMQPSEHGMPDEEVRLTPRRRDFADERFVTLADPFQARAVARSRESRAVVIHGPPGTGKSQTITNIIADHLARGQRVLFVCDKRTALDVVANRLDHLGLGRLCALVHDARKDQRDLYMKIRANLEDLDEIKTHSRVGAGLDKTDAQLAEVYEELSRFHKLIMQETGDGPSFHELMGRWLSIDVPGIDGLDEQALGTIGTEVFEKHRDDLGVAFERAASVGYDVNPWGRCAGMSLDDYLTRPVDETRRVLASCVEDARVADGTRHENIPPFDDKHPLKEQVARRNELIGLLERTGKADAAIRTHVLSLDGGEVSRMSGLLRDAQTRRATLDQALNSELLMVVGDKPPQLREVNDGIVTIERYREKLQSWTRLFAFGLKRKARDLLGGYGLGVSDADAETLENFQRGLRDRLVLSGTARQLLPDPPTTALLRDDELARLIDGYSAVVGAVELVRDDTSLAEVLPRAIRDDDSRAKLIDGLQRSAARAGALEALEQSMRGSGLFSPAWMDAAFKQLREGKQAGETLGRLQQGFDTLESVLRVQDSVARLPENLAKNVRAALRSGLEPKQAVDALCRGVLSGELRRRLTETPELNRLDSQRLAHLFDRYHDLEAKKRTHVRDYVLNLWVGKQQGSLLAGTGSRLNSAGAELRRRLFVRGKRAMRLRQVIDAGQKAGGGGETGGDTGGKTGGEADALFDMCPVWMASPETVAQVFPRTALFDVVIFDEASQCRLEEALPVLTRAKRVVIAGDPKQLPPTRFFEAAVSVSEDEELETDQDLFEAQQSEVEDLLAAALNLRVEEAYLDVHYRSRNADLIEFSNEYFYKKRLQSIPGHPKHRAVLPPLRLDRADGVYEERCNRIEAQRVVQIVDDLLKRADPPSIGIACFNITQRDLIVDMLDDRAVDDEVFAGRLAKARARVGESSFEGLFVKNLENVQGDERDHIIISTTYGPTKEGKFYRRFGPLGRVGGGRRLNVLVTRARKRCIWSRRSRVTLTLRSRVCLRVRLPVVVGCCSHTCDTPSNSRNSTRRTTASWNRHRQAMVVGVMNRVALH
ncbi:MAG: AAA domain-containing protein [Phycisphaerales bacterium]